MYWYRRRTRLDNVDCRAILSLEERRWAGD